MVVIDVEPWKEESEDDRPAKPISQLFGFQDLASDYYQVQEAFRAVEGLPPACKTCHFILVELYFSETMQTSLKPPIDNLNTIHRPPDDN